MLRRSLFLENLDKKIGARQVTEEVIFNILISFLCLILGDSLEHNLKCFLHIKFRVMLRLTHILATSYFYTNSLSFCKQ